MVRQRGTFIAIEGVDGSGKSTQLAILESRLREAGYDVATFKFPQYEQPSSYFVRKYLRGDYGQASNVGPYTSSLFYALDRFEAAPAIREAIEQGKVVLADRYTGSNMSHQGTKFRSPEERRGFFIWLDNLEYEMLRIPRPDQSFVLRMPVEFSQELLKQLPKKPDEHEKSPEHLTLALSVYDDMTQLFPKDFQRIDCVRDNRLLEVEAVQSLLWEKISPLLPPPPQLEVPLPAAKAEGVAPVAHTSNTLSDEPAVALDYYVPAVFPDAVKQTYRLHIDAILRLHGDMLNTLAQHLQTVTPATANLDDAKAVLQAILPIAVFAKDDEALRLSIETPANETLTKLAQDNLPANHATPTEAVQLTDIWPRNELDLVADILYGHTDLPLNELRAQTAAWPYNRKLEVMEAALAAGASTDILHKVHYTWDVSSSYADLHNLQKALGAFAQHQPLTPRFGYDVPEIIEAADLTEQYQLCFDASLELYSLLQKAGFEHDSQYATLAGHRVRWQLTTTATDLATLPAGISPSTVTKMHDKITPAHPILAELFATD